MSSIPPSILQKASDTRIRVLVVDDEPKIVDVVRTALERNHFDVVTASTGEQALAEAKNQRLDLILLDVAMPLMDGFEVLSRLRADKDTSRIPVVMVTAKSDTHSIFRAKELWAADYLLKPFDLDVLLSTVKRCAKLLP